MRKLMKRFAALFCVAVLFCATAIPAAAANVTAKPTTQKLYLMKEDGTTQEVVKELPIYNINYNNYMKIRDIGYLLDFQVEYNSEWKAVSIITTQHSDGVQVSTGKATSQQSAAPAWSKLYIDGKEVSGLTMYNISGNNYIKIRDIANAVGFGCCYSGELKAIVLSPFYGYSSNDVMTDGGRRTVAYADGQGNLSFSRSGLFAAASTSTTNTESTTYKTGETLTLKKGATYNVEVGVYEKVYIDYGELNGSNNTDWVEYDQNQNSTSGKRVAWMVWDKDSSKLTIEGLEVGSVQIQCLSTADYTTVFAYINVTVISGSGNNYGTNDTNSKTADFVNEVVRLVNVERAKEGLTALSTMPELTAAAQIRAEELPQAYSHTRPDGRSCFTVLDEAGISRYAAGENIAVSPTTPEAVVNAWMNSPGHRANILNENFTAIGVGHIYTRNGTSDNDWWVQLFIGCN